MSFLKGLFGGKRGLPPEERGALEQYLSTADPLLRQLDAEYRQWLEGTGVTRGTDVSAINDPKGEHSGVFVWRTIETERTFTQLQAPPRAARLHDAYVRCVVGRHEAASSIYEALQVAEVRPPKVRLAEASRVLEEAESVRKQAEQERQALERLLT
jgi:hypothetical protein